MNQPIWVQIAARNNCRIGGYGVSKLIGGTGGVGGTAGAGGPLLPNAGLDPQSNNPWNIVISTGILFSVFSVFVMKLKRA